MNDNVVDNIVDIEVNQPHYMSEVICVNCKKRWTAIRPETTLLINLECCGCQKTGFVIETGEVYELKND